MASKGVWAVQAAWAVTMVSAAACSNAPPTRDGRSASEAPGELAMRAPAPRSGGNLGELEAVKTGTAPEPSPDEPAPQTAEPAPIQLSPQAEKRPVGLQGRDLSLPGGLTIHRVPAGALAWVYPDHHVWEIARADGRRLALIQATSFSSPSRSDGQGLLDETRSVSLRATRESWGSAPVQVIVERLANDTYVYVIERRSRGTRFIPAGLELTRRSSK